MLNASYKSMKGLKFDAKQQEIIKMLESVSIKLQNPKPKGFLTSIFTRSKPGEKRGIYLHGTVGSGKTMLMDLFFQNVNTMKKLRTHYSQFMLDVHKDLKTEETVENPIAVIAKKFSKKINLLCLDEFQVTDIADAMILRGLIEALLANNVYIFCTSNRRPSELYFNGIQRQNFLPCIHLIESCFQILSLESEQDYRQLDESKEKDHMNTIEIVKQTKVIALFYKKVESQGLNIQKKDIPVFGSRHIQLNHTASKMAIFEFGELFASNFSSADYLAICSHFTEIFIEHVPAMRIEKDRDLIRRFISFVDIVYDRGCKLYFGTDSRIDDLFVKDPEIDSEAKISNRQRVLADDLGMKASDASYLFNGEEERFAVRRSISRLKEFSHKNKSEFTCIA